MIQHITFSVDFRNVDAADPRCDKITTLTFGGVVFDAASQDDEKEAAIAHVWNNVLPDAGLAAQFGKIIPLFSTFRLLKVTTPSDQGMA
jgi:ABC-type phosphate/phosphonate transport system ATPase subunit